MHQVAAGVCRLPACIILYITSIVSLPAKCSQIVLPSIATLLLYTVDVNPQTASDVPAGASWCKSLGLLLAHGTCNKLCRLAYAQLVKHKYDHMLSWHTHMLLKC